MKKQTGISKFIILLLLVPIIGTLVSGEVQVGLNQNSPRVVIGNNALSCSGCGSNTTYVNQTIINQYFNDTIWTNNSESIFPRAGYNQNINLSNRSLYISGTPAAGGKIVEINIENEGDYGLYITGNTADGVVVNGAVNLTNVFNGYGYSSESYYLAQQPNRSYWGYLSRPLIGFTANADELIGFLGAPRTFSAIIPYFGVLQNLTAFDSAMTWTSGNVTNAVGFKARDITYSGGIIVNNYGLKVENLSAGTNNYAIWTEDNLARLGGNLNVSKNVTAGYFIGNGSRLTGVCLTNGSNCQASVGNPFDQVLNTTSTVIFNNLTLNSSGGIPILVRRNTNSSIDTTDFIRILDNQSYNVMRLYGYGRLDISAPGNGRTIVFDPLNGAFDMQGSSLHMNRFSTSSNVVVGATGAGGVSSSLLVGNGVGNTNFGFELGKIVAATVGNNSRLFVAKGGLGQTRSAYSVLNFTDYEVFNVSTRGEVMAMSLTANNITATKLDLIPVNLPACNLGSRGFWVNSSDAKPYYCNTTTWNVLY